MYVYRRYIGDIWGVCWGDIGDMQGVCWGYIGDMLGMEKKIKTTTYVCLRAYGSGSKAWALRLWALVLVPLQ